MVQSGPNHGEVLAISDQLVEGRKRIRCSHRVRENEKRRVTREFLYLPHGLNCDSDQLVEFFNEICGGQFAM